MADIREYLEEETKYHGDDKGEAFARKVEELQNAVNNIKNPEEHAEKRRTKSVEDMIETMDRLIKIFNKMK